jgi:FAD/FMN-containing dehydrogenase
MMPDWSALQRATAGDVVLPSSPTFEDVRRPQIARFHEIRPQSVVLCTTAADVSEAVGFASRSGLHLSVRSGGHCFAGRSSTDGVVIDVGPMRGVEPSDGVVRIGAGARLAHVYDVLDARGGTIAGGCGPDVGIAGLLLGGGLGVLGRAHGLTCDQLVAAEVVLADGRVVRCDEATEPDLFWALRGAGGGQFGVVTELTLRVLEAPRATVFHLRFPRGRAAELIDAWQRWAPDAPDALAASLLCNRGGAHVFGSHAGPREEAEARLAALPRPEAAVVQGLPWRDAKRWLAEHGPGEGPPGGLDFSKSEFFREPLPTDAITALVDGFEAALGRGFACELDFSPWGGAYNRVPVDATAFAHRAERFLLKQAVVVEPGGDERAAREWLARSWASVHPWGAGGVYANFPDLELEDAQRAYHGPNLERLREVKAAYDPERVFTFQQSL